MDEKPYFVFANSRIPYVADGAVRKRKRYESSRIGFIRVAEVGRIFRVGVDIKKRVGFAVRTRRSEFRNGHLAFLCGQFVSCYPRCSGISTFYRKPFFDSEKVSFCRRSERILLSVTVCVIKIKFEYFSRNNLSYMARSVNFAVRSGHRYIGSRTYGKFVFAVRSRSELSSCNFYL